MLLLTHTALDTLIVLLSPLIIAVYVIGSLLIYKRQVSKGKNGLYGALMYLGLFMSLTWLTIETAYLAGIFHSASDLSQTLIKLNRCLTVVFGLLNLTQLYRGIKGD